MRTLEQRKGSAARLGLAALAAIALACGLETPPAQGAPQPDIPSGAKGPVPPAGYRLVWQDDFNGSALDASRWGAQSGPRLGSFMTPAAVSVAGGILTLTTYTDASGHETGFLSSEGRFTTTYGYFEARIRFQDSPGEWCSFWLLSPDNGKPLWDPATAGVEIDVVEHRVTDQGGWTALRDMVAVGLNWNGYAADRQIVNSVVNAPGNAPVQGEWHTYGVLWTDAGYTYYVDGSAVWSTSKAISKHSQHLMLTCEVDDGGWAGNVPAGGYGTRATSSTRMQVDWVRVWQP